MNTTTLPTMLSPRPTREELRDCLATLESLAAFNLPWVDEQLKAVRALMRARFPRASAKTRRRRGLPAEACSCTCARCGGRGTLNKPGVMYTPWTLPGGFTKRLPVPPIPCPDCKGSGITPGVGETVVEFGYEGGPPIRIRGDLARGEFTGCPDQSPRLPRAHDRGYLGGTRTPGSRGPAGMERMLGANDYRVPGYCGAEPCPRTPPSELSAMLEAQAQSALASLNFHLDPRTGVETRSPRGRRINGSRREHGVLKPGGQKRSRMVDRVGRLQADHDKVLRDAQPRPPRIRPEADPIVAQMRALGVDPTAYIAAARAQLDSERVERARRTADLPPCDPLPDWAADRAVMLADGRTVIVQGIRVGRTCVARLGSGATEWVDQAVMVRTQLGDLDLLHADDVPAVPAT